MTKHVDPVHTQADRLALFQGTIGASGAFNGKDRTVRFGDSDPKRFCHRSVHERASAWKAETKGGLSFAFLLKRDRPFKNSHVKLGAFEKFDSDSPVRVRHGPKQIVQTGASYGADHNNLFVFVDNIKLGDVVEYLIPATIRFEFFDLSDNVLSGKLGTSVVDGITKSLCPPSEWELHGPEVQRVIGLLADDIEHANVQRRADIVDSVSDDQPEFPGRGFILFDVERNLAGLWIPPTHQAVGPLGKIFPDHRLAVYDVLARSIELHRGAF